MKNWYRLRAARKTAEVLLYEEIGAWGKTAKEFAAELDALGDLKQINVRINSPGGDVFEALAMHGALSRHPAQVTVYIDALCASAATLVALAGDEIHIAESAMWMIHEPWTAAAGNSADLLKQSDLLDTVAAQIVNLYVRKTGESADVIREWMRAETWYTAEQALAAGFVDTIDPPLRMVALATHDLSKFKNHPQPPEPTMADDEEKTLPDDAPIPDPTPEPTPEVPGPEAARPLDIVSISRICNAAREPGLTPILLATPHTQEQVEARIAQAAAVRRVCATAKTPELADGLIAAGANETTAMLATWHALADRSDANPVDSTPPTRSASTMPRDQWELLTPLQKRDFARSGGKVSG